MSQIIIFKNHKGNSVVGQANTGVGEIIPISDEYRRIDAMKVNDNHVLAAAKKNGKWGVVYTNKDKPDLIILPFIFDYIIFNKNNKDLELVMAGKSAFFSFYMYRRISSLALIKRELQHQKPKIIKQLMR